MGSEFRNSLNPFARDNEDPVKILSVASVVALVCAVLVSTASILLDPIQQAQLEAERSARMEAMLDTLPGMRAVMEDAGVDSLETRMVNLVTGEFESDMNHTDFDFTAAAQDPEQSIEIPTDEDLASIKRRPNFAPVHLLQREGHLLLVVLPVNGAGYASMIRAFLALEPDLKTVAALTITEQADTPGLGARITEPEWQALWTGKELTNDAGEIVIEVVRGNASSIHQVDGISGATRTGNGVANMLRFWVGPMGYGPLLEKLKAGGA